MAMRNNIFFIMFFFLLILQYNCISQSKNSSVFRINSLQGKEKSIEIIPDLYTEKLIILLGENDSICLENFRGIEKKIIIYGEKFMEIKFRTEGGSGTSVFKSAIVAISDNKLFIAAFVISKVESHFKETFNPKIDSLNLYDENSYFKLDFVNYKEKENSFYMDLYGESSLTSKYDPKQNYEKKSLTKLSFDQKYNSFCNNIRTLDGCYKFNDESENKIFKEKKCPIISLKDSNEYINIDGIWYILSGNLLVKL
jgi:hypothetical protein